MRSIVVVSAVSLSALFALAACTGGGGSNGSGTSTALPAADGGSTKKPLKLPVTEKPKPVETPADDDDDVMPDPTPGLVPTCKGAALCVGECPDGDDACYEACMKDMPDVEWIKFEALGNCVNNSGCETDECLQDMCSFEIHNCLGE